MIIIFYNFFFNMTEEYDLHIILHSGEKISQKEYEHHISFLVSPLLLFLVVALSSCPSSSLVLPTESFPSILLCPKLHCKLFLCFLFFLSLTLLLELWCTQTQGPQQMTCNFLAILLILPWFSAEEKCLTFGTWSLIFEKP